MTINSFDLYGLWPDSHRQLTTEFLWDTGCYTPEQLALIKELLNSLSTQDEVCAQQLNAAIQASITTAVGLR